MVLAVTEGFGGSNGAQKQLTENWRRDWPMNGSNSKNWPGKGRLTESHCRKVIAQMYERTVGEPLHFRTAREHLSEWVESKKNETELRTYWKYRQTVR